jgi:hypothetical protein
MPRLLLEPATTRWLATGAFRVTTTTMRALGQALALTTAVLVPATAALGETATADQAEPEAGIETEEEKEAQAIGAASGWRVDPGLRVTLRGITARSTAPAEDEVIDGNAIAMVATPSLVLSKDDVTVTFRNSLTRLEFEDAGRTDRWQNTARLSLRYDLSDTASITAFGERSDNLLTAEFTSADEWEAGSELELRLDPANRVQLGASWRARSYDDATGSSGDGIRVDGEYRYRLAANHYVFLRGRYDEIASDDNLRRDLKRWLAEASYQRPIAPDLRVRGELTYQQLDFTGRPLVTGETRRDDLFWPELTLIWSPGAWRVAGEARYIVRNSTDPEFDRSGYRFELEVSHEF